MAAPAKYNENTLFLAEGLARCGLSDAQIAKELDISTKTYYEWLKKFPEFADAVAKGKAPVDIKVENALLKRALGYDYQEEHTEMTSDKEGKKVIKKKVIKKHEKPDVGAQIFWLINRMKDKWKQRRDESENIDVEEIKEILTEYVDIVSGKKKTDVSE
jgi:transcriptional regulator with XRE-family HTH domain